MSDYYNYQRRTVGTFFSDVAKHGLGATIDNRLAWGNMRMSPRDIADVTGATYTYLVNGQPPAANWTGLFKPGEKVRLRFINGSAMTYFDVRIPGMKMTVVAADGNNVEPVDIDEFRIGVAEVYDVIVEPRDHRAYTIFAQALDRSGYARATLAPRPGMAAAVPAMDPVPTRTMADMGMPGMTWAGTAKAGMKNMQNMTGFNGMDGLKGLYSSNDMGAMKDMNSMKGRQHADGMKNMERMRGMSRAVKNTTRKSGMAGFSPVAKQRNSKIKAHETAWPQPVHNNALYSYTLLDQLEARTGSEDTSFRWSGEGWYGTNYNRFWYKSEGEGAGDGSLDEAEAQALYAHSISRYFDVQVGVRHDFKPSPSRTWAAFGVEGLAPYFFDLDATAFVSNDGYYAGRLEERYELLFTQRLILEPQAEINAYSKSDRARGIGAGLTDIDTGLRLRYEIRRQFALCRRNLSRQIRKHRALCARVASRSDNCASLWAYGGHTRLLLELKKTCETKATTTL